MTAHPLPGHLPDRLATTSRSDIAWPPPEQGSNDLSPARGRWKWLLLLLCLVPRALMAWKIGGLCPDSVVYIQVAESFDKGLLHQDVHPHFGLNLFPAVLLLLHRAGLDWELAGKLWNVAISCLTVLPLYGWVRRQFDDRVALAAGCLYALHAQLIRVSPEGIRDPTFWFFLVLSLYLLWRAIAEVRLPLFVLGGVAMAMATLTRSEGLFLLAPLLLGSVWRGRALAAIPRDAPREASALRRKLALGLLLAVGVFPALLVLASTFWFRGHAPWELIRTRPLGLVEQWVRTGLAMPASHDAAAATMPWTTMVGRFVSAMFKGMTPVFALFTCIGAAGWRQTWKRRDQQVMFYTVPLFLLAIWIHLSVAEETTGRYFLPVALVMSPLAALGLLACSAQLSRWADRRRWGLKTRRLASCMPLLFFTAFSLGNVFASDYRQRAGQAELGRWTRNEFGPSPGLLGPGGVTQVVTYYARGRYVLFAQNDNDQAIETLLRQRPFDIVLLPDQQEPLPGRADLLRHAAAMGYGPIDGRRFSDQLRKMVVLARRNSGPKN
jgi:hypothetical protein